MTTEEDHVFYRVRGKPYPKIERGQGVYLFDSDGKSYLDFSGGPMVISIGHGVGEVIDAMVAQAKKVSFPYHGHFTSQAQIDLAGEIINFAPKGMSKVYIVSGGSEAVENAIKFALQYHIERGEPSRMRFVSLWQSYHGSTMACLSLGGRPWSRSDYMPYMNTTSHIHFPNCYRCPFEKKYPSCDLHCAYELERVIKLEGRHNIAGFFAEPISGNTLGAVVPLPEYFKIIRETCDRYGILLIADEVVTGFGRTGKNFGIDHWDVVPDIIASGKGMSSGYTPIGSVILHQKVWDVFAKSKRSSFVMGYTYSNNPMSCAIALAVLRYMRKEKLVERSSQMGKVLLERLSQMEDMPMIGQVRGKGLLLGIELVKNKQKKAPFERKRKIGETIAAKLFQRGLIILSGYGGADGELGDHLTITPPFIITDDEVEQAVQQLKKSIFEVCEERNE